MKNYTPPYTITSKILELTNNITQQLTELKYTHNQIITPMLRKKTVSKL
jgi:hypothetical protein